MDSPTQRFPPQAGLPSLTGIDQSVRVASFLTAVYGWMCVGLLVTAATAWYVASSPAILRVIVENRAILLGLMIAQLGLVFVLSARVQTMPPATATLLFVSYAALTGVTLSFILLSYTGESISSTFVITSGAFGGMALYGTVTRRSLEGFGQFLFMGLIGVLLASIVGMFWHSDGLQFIVSVIGVIVFAGLAAYDAQRLKTMALSAPEGPVSTYAVVGALKLYLDFINLFLFILRFTGNRRR
ncbi:MAG: Bax inhibitor-1/YccA family protein [Acidobacteriota bacterium]